jgi:hypothetical protein
VDGTMLKSLRKKLRSQSPLTTIVAILCLTVIELAALHKGINGALLTTVVGFIAGLGGYWLGRNGNLPQVPESLDSATEVNSS